MRKIDQKLTNRVHDTVDVALVKVNLLLAGMMFFYAILKIYLMFDRNTVHWNEVLGFMIMVACSILIFADRDRNLLRSTGLMAIATGSYRLLDYVVHIHAHDTSSAIPLICVILGLNLIYSGSRYMKGIARGRVIMMVSMILMVILNSSVIIMSLMFEDQPLYSVLITMPEYVVMTVMYVMFIGVLDSEELRSHDIMEIHNHALDGICRTETQPDGVGVTKEVAVVLSKSFTDRTAWAAMDNVGPVEYQYEFVIGKDEEVRNVILQKWKGSEQLHFTVCDHNEGTLIHAYRFHADSVFLDGNDIGESSRIIFIGNGRCYSLNIDHGKQGGLPDGTC